MMIFAFVININASSFGRNILTNGSFESDFTESGWSVRGGSWEIVSEDALDGNKMLKVTAGTGTDPWDTQVFVEPIIIDSKSLFYYGGDQFEISFYIKSDIDGEVRLSFEGMTNRWPLVNGKSSVITSSTWQKVVYSPETTSYDWSISAETLLIYFDLGYAPNVTYYIDDVRVVDLTSTTHEQVVIGGICYNLSGSHAEVTSNGGLYTGNVIIPSTVIYDDIHYEVTKIGDSAFEGCSNLTSITFPTSINSIKSNAFKDCKGLTSITIPERVKNIENSAFSGCGLTSITISEDVKSIGNMAFSQCENLASVIIGSKVASIGDKAFESCNNLISITIPENVTSIGDKAFDNCSHLTTVYFNAENCTIKSSIFSNCTSLSTIYIGDNVKEIPDNAFADCSALTTISIPEGVTSIGNAAFRNCKELTSIIIPAGVTSIGVGAFGGCNNLASITIPSGVTSIGWSAFRGCSSLTSITIPNSVTGLIAGLFEDCSNLTTVTIPSSITGMWGNLFKGCKSLTSIVNLNPVPMPIEVPSFGYEPFLDVDKNTCILYVPFGSSEAYRNANDWKDWGDWMGEWKGWNDFVNIIELPNISKEDIDITPSENNVLIEWLAYENAEGYKLIIYHDEAHTDTVCVLEFDAEGKLLRSVNSKISQTVENLSKGTDYYYTIEILGVGNAILASLSGKFKTSGELASTVETGRAPSLQPSIIGYYNIMGIKLPKEPKNELYIILYSDGKSIKMMKK